MTVQELIEAYLNRPEVAAPLAAWRASWDPLIGVLQDCHARIMEIWRALDESPPSPGYEPYLVRRVGANPVVARGMAKLIVRRGKGIAAERRRQPEVVKAIRFLATPGRRNKVFDRNVAVLLSAAKETTAIQTLFVSVGLDEIEFVDALRRVAERDLAARIRVVEIAATVARAMVVLRGRPVSAASAAHRFLVESLLKRGFERKTPLAYSYSSLEGDFVDHLTKATRLEFGDPDFDPRPTRRRQIRASREHTAQGIRNADPSR